MNSYILLRFIGGDKAIIARIFPRSISSPSLQTIWSNNASKVIAKVYFFGLRLISYS